jgi:hypothetical protein
MPGSSKMPALEAIRTLFRVVNRYVGNLPPMTGVFPDYPAPGQQLLHADQKRRTWFGSPSMAIGRFSRKMWSE